MGIFDGINLIVCPTAIPSKWKNQSLSSYSLFHPYTKQEVREENVKHNSETLCRQSVGGVEVEYQCFQERFSSLMKRDNLKRTVPVFTLENKVHRVISVIFLVMENSRVL